MPGHHYTSDEYALQQSVQAFGNHVFQLDKHHLTNTYLVLFRFCELKNIEYLHLRYLWADALLFEKLSENCVFYCEA